MFFLKCVVKSHLFHIVAERTKTKTEVQNVYGVALGHVLHRNMRSVSKNRKMWETDGIWVQIVK